MGLSTASRTGFPALGRNSTERKQRAEWGKQSSTKTHQCGTKLTACDTKPSAN